jgi:hypothetical protein
MAHPDRLLPVDVLRIVSEAVDLGVIDSSAELVAKLIELRYTGATVPTTYRKRTTTAIDASGKCRWANPNSLDILCGIHVEANHDVEITMGGLHVLSTNSGESGVIAFTCPIVLCAVPYSIPVIRVYEPNTVQRIQSPKITLDGVNTHDMVMRIRLLRMSSKRVEWRFHPLMKSMFYANGLLVEWSRRNYVFGVGADDDDPEEVPFDSSLITDGDTDSDEDSLG